MNAKDKNGVYQHLNITYINILLFTLLIKIVILHAYNFTDDEYPPAI